MSNYSYIPEEIITDILKRLAVKSVLRLACVQKSWYSLIHTPQFVTFHSDHQKSLSNNNKFLLCRHQLSSLSIRFDREEEFGQYYSPEYPTTVEQPIFHGMSNGLICFSSAIKNPHKKIRFERKIHIWNPAIRKFITLPPQYNFNHHRYRIIEMGLAIGFSPKFNDYKVVKIMLDYNDYLEYCDTHGVDVYSLSTNSWKSISHRLSNISWDIGYDTVFVNGAAFSTGWDIEKQIHMIVCVDTENDVVCEISLPQRGNIYSLQVYDESLAAFFGIDKHFNMWILEEGFSWNKIISVRIEDEFYWNVYRKILGVRNNGDLVILFEYYCLNQGDLFFYNVQKDTKKFVDRWNGYHETQLCNVYPFMESLVGLNTFFDYTNCRPTESLIGLSSLFDFQLSTHSLP